jgi:hypothetical protein
MSSVQCSFSARGKLCERTTCWTRVQMARTDTWRGWQCLGGQCLRAPRLSARAES